MKATTLGLTRPNTSKSPIQNTARCRDNSEKMVADQSKAVPQSDRKYRNPYVAASSSKKAQP